jgi:hypothetical protein
MVAGLAAVVLAAVGVVFVAPNIRSPMTVPGDKVLIVVAGRSGKDGSQVAQLIGVAELRSGKLTVGLVDPMTTVTVPGTTYDRLADAYPFGGGAGVAKAYAAAAGSQPLPVVAVSEQGLRALIDLVGGVTVTVPTAVNVFDGRQLYTFDEGPRRVTGADVVALLSAADYLKPPEEGVALRSAVASALVDGIAASSADLQGLGVGGGVSSTLRASDFHALATRLRGALGDVTIVPFSR